MKYKLLIAAVVVAGLVYLLFSTFFVDVQINKYTDIAAVKDQQAIQKGWVPTLLPPSAYDIKETHDIDTNEIFGEFYYKESDEKSLVAKLSLLTDHNDTYECGKFLFKIDTDKNIVKYRNKP